MPDGNRVALVLPERQRQEDDPQQERLGALGPVPRSRVASATINVWVIAATSSTIVQLFGLGSATTLKQALRSSD